MVTAAQVSKNADVEQKKAEVVRVVVVLVEKKLRQVEDALQ